MKKMLSLFMFALVPSFVFALAGFGIQVGSDLSKLGSYSYSEGSGLTEVTINTYEMESNPGSFGGYAFVDLFGFALEAEGEIAGGKYEFDFTNQFLPEMEKKIPFVWGRGSYSFTLKKNIMDLSIPFLAKAAVNAGGGFGSHAATKRVNVDMVRSILGEEDLSSVNLGQDEIETLIVPADVGGRFSVLTPVGFLPALFAGINKRYTRVIYIWSSKIKYSGDWF